MCSNSCCPDTRVGSHSKHAVTIGAGAPQRGVSSSAKLPRSASPSTREPDASKKPPFAALDSSWRTTSWIALSHARACSSSGILSTRHPSLHLMVRLRPSPTLLVGSTCTDVSELRRNCGQWQ